MYNYARNIYTRMHGNYLQYVKLHHTPCVCVVLSCTCMCSIYAQIHTSMCIPFGHAAVASCYIPMYACMASEFPVIALAIIMVYMCSRTNQCTEGIHRCISLVPSAPSAGHREGQRLYVKAIQLCLHTLYTSPAWSTSMLLYTKTSSISF